MNAGPFVGQWPAGRPIHNDPWPRLALFAPHSSPVPVLPSPSSPRADASSFRCSGVRPHLILSLISVSPLLACTRGCPQHPRSPGVQCKVLLSCPSVFLLCRTSLSGQVGTSAEHSRTFPAAVARPPTVCVHECPLPKVRAKNYPGIEGAAV